MPAPKRPPCSYRRLASNRLETRYAVHTVADRTPRHLNILLAEADVPYEKLYDMDTLMLLADTNRALQ